MRWFVVVLLVLHGSIHSMGFLKAFRFAELPQLALPIGRGMGALWLTAAVLCLISAVFMLTSPRWWWVAGALAVVVSQVCINTSWADAKFGTVPNALILVAVVYGFLSQGPLSYRAEYATLVAAELSRPPVTGVVTEADLAHLPVPVAAYVRRSGAVGRPRVFNFRARFRGTIRSRADASWMAFTGEQVNRLGPDPSRLFFLDASMFGVPADVFHAFIGPSANMRVKVWSLVKIVDERGPLMTQAETVTLFNDLCVFAPAALVDPAIHWEPVNDRSTRATFTNGPHTIRAVLHFNDEGDLADFVSDDRLRGTTPERWSTPLRDYRSFGGRRVSTRGEGRWHAPAPEGAFTYIVLELTDIVYNVRPGA